MAPDHSCWTDTESAKKVRKNRFGGVRQSEVAGLNHMLTRYREESCEWVESQVRERWKEMGLSGDGERDADETESEGKE